MQSICNWLFRAFRRLFNILHNKFDYLICRILFYIQKVQVGKFSTRGRPYILIAAKGKCIIGNGFSMNNTISSNPIGLTQPCIFFVDNGATLEIRDNVGISQASIICHTSITIGNHVKIGGGVCIYDTDFHSLDPALRKDRKFDFANKKKKPVIIKDNAFIGAHSIILKGVIIGENSVVGAGSVVTKNIPDNEIWAGNPACKVRELIISTDNDPQYR
ncbi:MAG: transferase [Sphingobacteriales bacterium 44-15]|nr:MAG: transferase [Sphingobacteriales bacterium 44-15]